MRQKLETSNNSKFLSCQQLISTGALVLIPKTQFLPAQENDENKRKNDKLFEWLKDLEFDIICLQATHFVNECEFIYNSR